ncbi:SdpA family antimicrobial peptide system protein [Streptomyces sp. NBC_00076]|uniref:SdpA family antimicrobial peptide system protein n=1 Tax=Streptomyces sp. NBC_00076 TaxID=2975642 RepID=UPI003250F54C
MRIIVVGAVVAVLGIIGIHSQLPRNALELPGESSGFRENIGYIFPQGWAFFTKSPRDPTIEMFKIDAQGNPEKLSLTPHSAPHNFFGLGRKSRAQGPEYALLVESVPYSTWAACGTELKSCLAPKLPAHEVVDRTPSPTFCGDVYAVSWKPQPWAWRDITTQDHVPERVLHLKVKCES